MNDKAVRSPLTASPPICQNKECTKKRRTELLPFISRDAPFVGPHSGMSALKPPPGHSQTFHFVSFHRVLVELNTVFQPNYQKPFTNCTFNVYFTNFPQSAKNISSYPSKLLNALAECFQSQLAECAARDSPSYRNAQHTAKCINSSSNTEMALRPSHRFQVGFSFPLFDIIDFFAPPYLTGF